MAIRALVIAAALCLVAAVGVRGWQQVRLASAVKVAGPVIRVDCSTAFSEVGCRPVVQYTTLDGRTFELRGDPGVPATTFEVDQEWRDVLYWTGSPPRAAEPGADAAWTLLALLTLAIGLVALVAGRAALPEPTRGPGPAGVRVAAGLAGGALLAVAWLVVAPRHPAAPIATGVVALGATVAVLLRLRHLAVHGVGSTTDGTVGWAALWWVLALLGAVTGVGLVVLPLALHAPLLAAAPLAVAFTLPQQMRSWPAAEQAVPEVLARRRMRRRVEAAVRGTGGVREMVVRVESIGVDEIDALRRTAEGDVPLRVVAAAFGRMAPHVGSWVLVVSPTLDQVPTQGGGGYRTAASTEGLVGASAVEALGPDLDQLLRGDPDQHLVRLVAPPVLLTFALALAGALALADREPPLSGSPIPRTALRERLERDRAFAGRVLASDHPSVVAGRTCAFDVEPSSSNRNCFIAVECSGGSIYGGWAKCLTSAAGALVAEDTSPTDGDPAIRIDTRARRVALRGESPKWAVTIDLVGR